MATDYSYIAPDDIEGKKCVARCHIQKQQCEQRAQRDYTKCIEKNKESNETLYIHGSFCKRYNCRIGYNECFSLCGGEVQSYTYDVTTGRRVDTRVIANPYESLY